MVRCVAMTIPTQREQVESGQHDRALNYVAPPRSVSAISFEAAGDVTHVFIPSSPARTTTGLAVALLFVVGCGVGMMWVLTALKVARFEAEEWFVLLVGLAILGGGGFYLIRALVRTARLGQASRVISISKQGIVIYDPMRFGQIPHSFPANEIRRIVTRSDLTATLSHQVTLRIRARDRRASDFVFFTRDKTVYWRLRAIIRQRGLARWPK
jgi:hypothetical protein